MSETQTPTPTPTATPWYTGKVDQVMEGFIQNHGYDKMEPAEAAIKAMRSYQEAQKMVGVPPELMVRLPKEATDAEGWKAVYKRLGAPDDATGYDFSTVKRADGSDPDAALTEALRQAAAKTNLPKDAAARVLQDLVAHMDGQATRSAADRQAALDTEKAALKANWGQHEAANMLAARQAAAALGVAPEAVAALEGQIGYAKVMEMFRNISSKIGEDKFVTGGPGNTGNPSGVLSVSQAHDVKRGLMSDNAWVSRYMAGDTAAVREMTGLNTIISSGMPV